MTVQRRKAGLVVLLLVGLTTSCQSRVVIYEIPEGYTGWVVHDYGVDHCEAEKTEPWATTVRVDSSGLTCSESWLGPDYLSHFRYYYVDSQGRRTTELRYTGWGKGGKIWGGHSWSQKTLTCFFVGSESQFRQTTGPDPLVRRWREQQSRGSSSD